MTVGVFVCILPEKLTLEWSKQPLGDQMVTNVASLLQSGNVQQCKSDHHFSDLSADNTVY